MKVVDEQSDFDLWNTQKSLFLRPRASPFECKVAKFLSHLKSIEASADASLHRRYIDCVSKLRRRDFVKICTERYFKDDLRVRGYDIPDTDCRFCRADRAGASVDVESKRHVLSTHVYNVLKCRPRKFAEYLLDAAVDIDRLTPPRKRKKIGIG